MNEDKMSKLDRVKCASRTCWKFVSSNETAQVIAIAAGAVQLFRAIESYRRSKRKIGFGSG